MVLYIKANHGYDSSMNRGRVVCKG